MKDADQVFSLRRIDAGFAADGAIDLREGGDVGFEPKRTPRRRIPAAKPARSPMTPPPNGKTRSPRSRPSSKSRSDSVARSRKFFVASPGFMTIEPANTPSDFRLSSSVARVIAGDILVGDNAALDRSEARLDEGTHIAQNTARDQNVVRAITEF